MSGYVFDGSTVDRRGFLRLLGAGVSIPVIAGLTGCGGGGSGALGGGSKGGKVTELIVPTNRSPWLPAYRQVAAQYEKESGVKITLREFPYDGLRTQMTNAIQNKSAAFDLFQLDEPWTGQFYDSNWVAPLADIDPAFKLDQQVLGYDALAYWDRTKRTSATSGTVMGLPINGNVGLFVYRKDLYQQLGLSVPTTWEQAAANGELARRSGKIRYGNATRGQASLGGQSITYEYMPVFYSYGANWFVDEGSDWTPAVNSPAALAATEMYKRLLALGPDQPQTLGQAEVIALVQGGQTLQAQVVAAAAPQLEDPTKSQVVGKLGYAVLPAGPSGKAAPTSGTWSLCVPTGLPAERAKAAVAFIRWMLDKAQQAKFTQAGGIPTRADVLAEQSGANSHLPAISASMPNARRAVRYVFAAPMLESTERILSEIGAGKKPVRQGLDELQSALTKVVRDAGFLK
jgi:multiple sugar transport system substrate-binding protein